MIYDMRPLYEKVEFDGNDFVFKKDRKIIPVVNSNKEIVLDTKYLLGIYFEVGRLLEKHVEYFPDYIKKYL